MSGAADIGSGAGGAAPSAGGAGNGRPASPIALRRQIECVAREIGLRERVYPKWIASRRISPTRAHEEITAMQAVLKTLEWLAANEHRIKARVEAVRAAEADPAVAGITDTFPGATIATIEERATR